jgi:hypothetical protein
MKPCSRNRKGIAWLALHALDAQNAAALREHLTVCAGCLRYWEELSAVTEKLATVPPEGEVELSPMFHQRVAKRLHADESGPILETLSAYLRGPVRRWRLALLSAAALAAVLVAFVVPWRHPAGSLVPLLPAQVTSPPMLADLAPTVANYQAIASQSLDKLDELLTEQGNKSLPPAPIFSASTFLPSDSSF